MDVMQIASLSMAMSQRDVMTSVNVSLMKNAMNSQTEIGHDISKLLETTMVNPERGMTIDVSV